MLAMAMRCSISNTTRHDPSVCLPVAVGYAPSASEIFDQLRDSAGLALPIFSLLAVVTSLLGVGLGCVDFAEHGFRNRTLRKRAYGGGIANCSKTAPLFSMRSHQSSGMAAPEGLDQVPSSIIGGASS